MPKVLSYTPSWLARNTSGFQVFAESTRSGSTNGLKPPQPSSSSPKQVSRLIARRGTQIFVAVGNEIRWADLVYLKDYEAEKNATRKTTPVSLDSYPESLFRVGAQSAS
jgi:nucleoporin NUP82